MGLFREGAVWPWGKLHHEAMQMREGLAAVRGAASQHRMGPHLPADALRARPTLRCREKGALRREPPPGARHWHSGRQASAAGGAARHWGEARRPFRHGRPRAK